MRVGLYSITYLGLWYRGEALTVEQLIRRAREYGYEGVEIDGKRPHGNPLDMPRRRCKELRRMAAGEGVEIYAVAANNDFSSPIPEQREAQIAYVRNLIRMTADLRAKLLRVFAAWPGVTRSGGLGRYDVSRRLWQQAHEPFSQEETWAWCREGLAECACYADQAGVTLALQNHPPVIETHHDMLRMIREVGSPHLQACLDAPLVARYETTAVEQAVRATGGLQALSHFGGEYDQALDGSVRGFVRSADNGLELESFYADFLTALLEIGYEGFLGYELCHQLPVVDGETVGIEFADRNARLAAQYMKGLIAEVRADAETPSERRL
ncbi:MAG: sugar phosphate isomerase/epimerase [Acidobacteria bacterium]|nr:sugar phosphate isomerase/epimerase [Acidobacteriota bacterium]